MSNQEKIVFLYRVGHVPEEIVAKALADTPEGFSLTFTPEEDSDEKRRELVAGADYLICYGRGFDDFDVANKAKIFQVLSAGYDRLDIGAFTKIGIPVANNGGANAPTVAEHAIMLMLAVYKKLPTHHYALHNGEWLGHRHALVMRELRGKQVGVVGFGNIGQQVARIANGFLANVAFFDPSLTRSSWALMIYWRPPT
jgi:lactate dehydrogenase-like 2-hydroxyacid dehydrogenase